MGELVLPDEGEVLEAVDLVVVLGVVEVLVEHVHQLLLALHRLQVLEQRPLGPRHLLAHQPLPVQPGEVRVALDVVDGVGAQALPGVLLQEFLEEVAGGVVDPAREGEFAVLDVVVEGVDVLGEEGGLAEDELEDDDAEAEVVGLGAHALLLQHLRGEVGGTAAEGLGEVVLGLLAEPEVHQLHVPVAAQHHVLGLEVAVDDAQLVHVLQRQHDLSSVEADVVLGEGEFLVDVLGEVAALAVLEAEVDVGGRLEGEVQGDDEGVADLLEDVDLGDHELRLLAQDDLLLRERLERVQPPVPQALHQEHLPELPLPQELQHLEVPVLQRHPRRLLIRHARARQRVVVRLRLQHRLVQLHRARQRVLHGLAERQPLGEEVDVPPAVDAARGVRLRLGVGHVDVVLGDLGTALLVFEGVPGGGGLADLARPLVGRRLVQAGVDRPRAPLLPHHEAEPLLLHVPALLLGRHHLDALHLLHRDVPRLLVLLGLLLIGLEGELGVDVVLLDGADVAVDRQEDVLGEVRGHAALDDLAGDDLEVGVVDDLLLGREGARGSGDAGGAGEVEQQVGPVVVVVLQVLLVHQQHQLRLLLLREPPVPPQVLVGSQPLFVPFLEVERGALDDLLHERQVDGVDQLEADPLPPSRVVEVEVDAPAGQQDVDGALVPDRQRQLEGQPPVQRPVVDVHQRPEVVQHPREVLVLVVEDGRVEQGVACLRRVEVEDRPEDACRLEPQDHAHQTLELEEVVVQQDLEQLVAELEHLRRLLPRLRPQLPSLHPQLPGLHPRQLSLSPKVTPFLPALLAARAFHDFHLQLDLIPQHVALRVSQEFPEASEGVSREQPHFLFLQIAHQDHSDDALLFGQPGGCEKVAQHGVGGLHSAHFHKEAKALLTLVPLERLDYRCLLREARRAVEQMHEQSHPQQLQWPTIMSDPAARTSLILFYIMLQSREENRCSKVLEAYINQNVTSESHSSTIHSAPVRGRITLGTSHHKPLSRRRVIRLKGDGKQELPVLGQKVPKEEPPRRMYESLIIGDEPNREPPIKKVRLSELTNSEAFSRGTTKKRTETAVQRRTVGTKMKKAGYEGKKERLQQNQNQIVQFLSNYERVEAATKLKDVVGELKQEVLRTHSTKFALLNLNL